MNALPSVATCVITMLMVAGSRPAAQETGNLATPLGTVRTFVKAIETADLELLLSTFRRDATVFMPATEMRWTTDSPGSPALLSGTAAIREAMGALFAGVRAEGPGPRYFVLQPRDEAVQTFADMAVVTFHLGSLPKQPVKGPATFARRTFVLHREGTRWLIVHHHGSNAAIVSAPR